MGVKFPHTATVFSKCPHCSRANPTIEAEQIGESTDAVLVVFIPQCCKKLLGCQLLGKAAGPKPADVPV